MIAAHLDDEVLSTGGLIRKRVCVGGPEAVRVLAMCGRKYGQGLDAEMWKRQMAHATEAQKILGYDELTMYQMEEGEPTKVGYYAMLEKIELALTQFKPDEVVIPGAGDLNQDHRFLNEVCRIALRPANRQVGTQEGPIRRIIESIAHDRLDGAASAHWGVVMTDRMVATVQSAMACYEDEVRQPPHPRSPVNIEARYRFYGSHFGFDFVEPYRMVAGID